MLYKPTSPSPYAESVVWKPEDETMYFSCSSLNSNIEQTRLKIANQHMQYYFDPVVDKSEAVVSGIKGNSITVHDYGATINYAININEKYNYYTITTSDSPVRRDGLSGSLSNVMTGDSDYKWQVRLYEKDSLTSDDYRSNIWLGYGTAGVYSSTDSSDDEDIETTIAVRVKSVNNYYQTNNNGEYIMFPIRPHTNIYFPLATCGYEYLKKSINGKSVKLDIKKFYAFYDDKAKYYIKINGKSCPIVDYRFYDPTKNVNKRSVLNGYFDNYGEPKDAYVIIRYDENLVVHDGDQYEIYCNYIDSDEFYFNTITSPTLTLTDVMNTTLEGTKDVPFSLEYSSLTVKGDYKQSGGATVNYYRCVLFLYDETGEYKIVDDTGEVYNSNLSYSYNRFLADRQYKLIFTTYDTNKYKTEKIIYIKPSYKSVTAPLNVSVTYHPEHDSNVIDFSNIISISAKQTDMSAGYALYSINEDGALENNDNTTCCLVKDNNSFIYDSYDGGSALSFINPLIYMQIRLLAHKTGLIAHTTDDNGIVCSLAWDGYNLSATWTNRENQVSAKSINLVKKGVSIIDNTSYVYAWNDEDIWSDNNIWHENNPLSENWWTVIITTDNIYAKQHNVDNDYKKGT